MRRTPRTAPPLLVLLLLPGCLVAEPEPYPELDAGGAGTSDVGGAADEADSGWLDLGGSPDGGDAGAPDVGDSGSGEDAGGTHASDAADAAGDGDAGDAGDAGGGEEDTGPPPETVIGQLNVTLLPPDAYAASPDLFAHAVFDEVLMEVGFEDPVGWLAADTYDDIYLRDGYWPIPEPGELVYVHDDELGERFEVWIEDLAPLDAGAFVAVGDRAVAGVDEVFEARWGVRAYSMLLEDGAQAAQGVSPGDVMDVVIDGGADVGHAALAQAVRIPEGFQFTSHDPTRELPLRPGQPTQVTWERSQDPDALVLFGALGPIESLIFLLPDTGRASLSDLLVSDLANLGAEPVFSFARVNRSLVQLPEGRLSVVVTNKQFLHTRAVRAHRLRPRVLPLGETVEVEAAAWDERLDPAGAFLDLGPDVAVEDVRVLDSAGHEVAATVAVGLDATTGPRTLRMGDGDEARIEVPRAAWVVDQLPSAGDCESAVDEGPVADGAWMSTHEGLPLGAFDTSPCPGYQPDGAAQAIPVALLAGQRLEAEYTRGKLAGALYVVAGCDDPQPVRACATSPRSDMSARLRYTADRDETVLLVADTFTREDVDPGAYVVDLRRTDPAPVTLAPDVLDAGTTVAIEAHSHVGPFTQESARFDLGDAVTVEEVTVPGGESDTAQVRVTVAEDAVGGWVDLTADVGGEQRTTPGALVVRRWVGGPSTCDEAALLPPLGPGTYAGQTGDTESAFDVALETCLGGTATAGEAVFRVELGPAETLRATARFDEAVDLVMYVLDGCEGRVIDCSDTAASGLPEVVDWTASSEGDTVYLVVDGFNEEDAGRFLLELEVGLL